MRVDKTTICEFAGMVPESLTQAFSHPKLEGWVCLAGAYQARSKSVAADMPPGKGLAAFGKGEERLLVMLVQDNATLGWSAFLVSETALYKNRDLFIRYGGNTGKFEIVYPISDTETEYFGCRVVMMSRLLEHPYVCELYQYCHINNGDNTMFIVDARPNIGILSWYHTSTVQNGSKNEVLYPALNSGLMEYINVSDFPTTEEACREAAAASQSIPDGYGITASVHLRKDTSSHSQDLGMYMPGTLVEILDILPGTSAPWYHVRIGVAEGYMSGNYVSYKEDQPGTIFHAVLRVGRLKNDTQLKQGTGLLDAAVVKLPAGSLVRVLADGGNWLHVSVPGDENSWFMQQGETNGFIKKSAVDQATVPLQLDWLTPGDE